MSVFKTLSSKTGKALRDFNMLEQGDKILLCFSGGKDSYTLIKLMQALQKKYPISFELKILSINPQFDFQFHAKLKQVCENFSMEYDILQTGISSIMQQQSSIKKMNPCFMCSRLRRGIIYDYAIKHGFNKIALGHTLNDAIETHLMNLFFSHKTSFLKPKYTAENGQVEIIRPMIYVDEKLILEYLQEEEYVPIANNCPMRKEDSKREVFRKIISDLEQVNPKIKESAFHAFKNTSELNSWEELLKNSKKLS